MRSSWPQHLDYLKQNPIAIPHQFKFARFNPIGGYQQNIQPGSYVRFNIATNYFLDPYSTLLRITVDFGNPGTTAWNPIPRPAFSGPTFQQWNTAGSTDSAPSAFTGSFFLNQPAQATYPTGSVHGITNDLSASFVKWGVQLDQSSQSLIQQLTIYEKEAELERIVNYDIVANCLHDMMYNADCRPNRDFEGMGGINTATMSNNVYGATQTNPSNTIGPGALMNTADATRTNRVSGNSYYNNIAEIRDAYWPSTANPAPNSLAQRSTNGVHQGRWSGESSIPRTYPVWQTYYMNAVWSVPNQSPTSGVAQEMEFPLEFTIPNISAGLNSGYYSYSSGSGADSNYSVYYNASSKAFYSPWRNMFYTWDLQLLRSADASALTEATYQANLPAGRANQGPAWLDNVPVQLLEDCGSLGCNTLFRETCNPDPRNPQTTMSMPGKTSNMTKPSLDMCGGTTSTPYNQFMNGVKNKSIETYEHGVIDPFPQTFCTTNMEPFLSGTIRQRFVRNGWFVDDFITSWEFFIPLMSGLFGWLMPPQQFKLIPMRVFKDLVFEFLFNPNAFFSSCWNTDQSKVRYTVTNLELHCELADFDDPMLIAAIDASIIDGLTIPTCSWYHCTTYAITGGSQVPSTVQINVGFESLRALMFCFIARDYERNTAARKHYRLSQNITSMWIKVGTEYYPNFQIEGNGGTNAGQTSNYFFYYHLIKAFGKHVGTGSWAINPHNFAINFREFNPQIQMVASTSGTVTNYAQSYTPLLIALYQANFFAENRIIGKALYAIDLDTLNYDYSLLSGVNTINAKPFELLLDSSNVNMYPNNNSLFVFGYYDKVYRINSNGILALGVS